MLVQDKDGKFSSDGLKAAVKKLATLCKDEGATLHVSQLLVDEMPELQGLLSTHFIEEGKSVSYYTEPTV
jgi:hypothetical protein